MNWSVFYIDHTGEGLSETYADWPTAHETLKGFVAMVNPPNTEVTFQRLADEAQPEREFHATDGTYSFAIETI
jgi:hypothetical protein